MNVLEVFTGNPFNTPVGQRIDKATEGSLSSEDWGLNLEICDIINETDEGPKDGIRALRKKLTNSIGKDWRSVHYCLVVLETCVKNCGKRFHVQVANKDFLQDLVKILAPKNDASVTVQEKVLGLIQIWTDAFKGSPELKAVENLYHELKQKGIEFPATDMDHMAPIHTPKSSMEPPKTSPVRAPSGAPHMSQPQRAPAPVVSSTPATGMPAAPVQQPATRQPSAEQMSKLRSDIDIVQGNCRVFNEMLNVCTPGSSELTQDTIELMKELNRTCRQMQQRIVVLIEQIADEQVTEVLLRVNDDLNNAFLRYDRLERVISLPSAKTPASTQPAMAAAAAPPPPSATGGSDTLIDFGPADPSPAPPGPASAALSAHMDNLALNAPSNITSITDVPAGSMQPSSGGADDFDVFAQSRKYDTKTAPSAAASYSFQTEASQSSNSMGLAASGRSNPYAQEEGAAAAQPSATSSEFDKFLEERAAAGEKLPPSQPSNEPNSEQQRPTRQLHKDDSENALFAL